MTSDSLIQVVQLTIDATGMTEVSLEDRTRLLSDRWTWLPIQGFPRLPGAGRDTPYPDGALPSSKQWETERYHQSIKQDVNQVSHEVPGDLEVATLGFVDYYNHRRYHKALGNVTPNDVLRGRRDGILIRRSEVKAQTSRWRQRYNRQCRES